MIPFMMTAPTRPRKARKMRISAYPCQERRKNLMFELVSAACPVVEINAEQIQSSPCIARKRIAAKNAE